MIRDDNAAKQSYNKIAIIGFILSLLAVPFGNGSSGIAGLALGIASLIQMRKNREKGKGLAIAAIVVGFIWGFAVGIVKKLIDMGYIGSCWCN